MSRAPSSDLEVLVRMSAAVHATIREADRSPHAADVVAMGADGTPTEELDRIAERRILELLETERRDWNVLSEEIGVVQRGGQQTLILDPIDGTHNALRGLPFSAISLALARDTLGDVDVGVVHDLARGTLYWAIRGQGAFRNGERIRTRAWDPRRDIFFVNLGRHATPRAVALSGKCRRTRSLGCASLEMCLVADGGGDAYVFENDAPERNLRVTDIAAAYRILIEAGGGVTDLEHASLETLPLDLQHHSSIFAFGDPKLSASAQGQGYL